MILCIENEACVRVFCVCSFIAVQKKKTYFSFCYDTKNKFGPHNYWMAKEKNVALIYLKVFRSFNSLHNFDWKDAPC